jgi:hypothetical protein
MHTDTGRPKRAAPILVRSIGAAHSAATERLIGSCAAALAQ